MADVDRLRLVILGGAGVGKSSIIKRFLFKTYSDKYRATIEDLYSREFYLGGAPLKVDILDTSGDMQFPAMRRLSIATAHAFILVYAATSEASFGCIKQCFEEIREQRPDYQEIPVVIAGNKLDLASTHREVRIEDVSEWAFCEIRKLRVKVLECSAKNDVNITELFTALLSVSQIVTTTSSDSTTGLKRRSSAYVSGTSKTKASISGEGSSKPCTKATSEESTMEEEKKPKRRSRSLIRRSSRKTKQQIQGASDNCYVQ